MRSLLNNQGKTILPITQIRLQHLHVVRTRYIIMVEPLSQQPTAADALLPSALSYNIHLVLQPVGTARWLNNSTKRSRYGSQSAEEGLEDRLNLLTFERVL